MAYVNCRTGRTGKKSYLACVRIDGTERRFCGFTNKRTAEDFGNKVEALKAAKVTGGTPPELAIWVSRLDPEATATKKLAEFGLVPERQRSRSLAELVELYCSDDSKKPRTLRNRRVVGNTMLNFFGGNRTLDSFTPSDADKIYLHMKNRLSTGTLQRQTTCIKSFFNYAVSIGWLLGENPFSRLRGGCLANRKKDFFVDETMAQKILEACPDSRCRLIFSLARWGGLRVPSELVHLKWSDVFWSEGRFRVTVPKLTGLEAEAAGDFTERFCPLFPEIRKALEGYWETLPEGSPDRIFPEVDGSDSNATLLRKKLRQIVRSAGLTMWPKPFTNLRSTRATELQKQYPLHLESAWLGHSPEICLRHYSQTTDEDFLRASGEQVGKNESDENASTVTSTVKSTAQGIANNGRFTQRDSQVPYFCEDLQKENPACDSTQTGLILCVGLEPTTR